MNDVLLYKALEKARDAQCSTCQRTSRTCYIKDTIIGTIGVMKEYQGRTEKYTSLLKGLCNYYE